ncbi:hypothetical protein MA16_Dca023445 [Dendrobium catenatum]|uniref:Uncharacterized protein n=1 Tax=Dendrobium catenatum TaxID=906689 RepID=A0A2I0WYL6_9ASPA|nr:hypothetical protein MA16_Dca023445 [Dendrobium catenatum]
MLFVVCFPCISHAAVEKGQLLHAMAVIFPSESWEGIRNLFTDVGLYIPIGFHASLRTDKGNSELKNGRLKKGNIRGGADSGYC